MSQAASSAKSIVWIAAGLLVLLCAVAMNSQSVATFLLSGDVNSRWPDVVNGAILLKILLVTDAVLLLGLGWFYWRSATVESATAEPMWQSKLIANDLSAPNLSALFVAILILSAILRVLHLSSDLWIDEVLTLVQYVQPTMGEIVTDFTDDNQHLLFSILAKLSTGLFGESAWAVRLPAMVFGVASVWATYRLGRMVYGDTVAIYGALLLCISYHHVWFSQNARGYTLLLFGTVFATELLLRALRSGQWRHWVAYAAMLVFCVAAHLSGVFVAVAHALVLFVVYLLTGKLKSLGAKPVVAYLLSAWGTLHCYALMIPQMIKFFQPAESQGNVFVHEWKNPLWLVNEVIAQLGISSTLGWGGIAILLLVSGLVGIWYWRRDSIALCLMVIPGIVMAGSMIMLGRNLWPRLFFNMAGFVVLLAAVMLIAIGRSGKRWLPGNWANLAWIPAVLLVIGFLIKLPDNYAHPKQNYTEARDFVRENMSADDSVIGLHMAGKVYQLYYAREWPVVNSVEEIAAYQPDQNTTWLLYTLPRYLKNSRPDINAKIQDQFEIVKIFRGTLGDGDIFVVRSKQKETKGS